MEIEMDSENKNQLKIIRKPLLLLIQEESLAKKKKKKISLSVWEKWKNVQRKRRFSKNLPYSKPSLFFHVLTSFGRNFKNKNSIMSNSSGPSRSQLSKFCVMIIATTTRSEHQQVFRWNINIVCIAAIVDLRNHCNRCFICNGNRP